jgi:hypothetical protein
MNRRCVVGRDRWARRDLRINSQDRNGAPSGRAPPLQHRAYAFFSFSRKYGAVGLRFTFTNPSSVP